MPVSLSTAFAHGDAVDRPAASSETEGFFYFSEDTGDFAQIQGGTWVTVAAASGVHVSDPILVSNAELLALHTTAKQVLAAQGAGTLIVPLHALWVGLGGTAYANDEVASFNLYLGADPTDFPVLAGDATVHLALPNFVHRSDFNYSGQIGAGGPPYNLPLNLKLTEAITGGTAGLSLVLFYYVKAAV